MKLNILDVNIGSHMSNISVQSQELLNWGIKDQPLGLTVGLHLRFNSYGAVHRLRQDTSLHDHRFKSFPTFYNKDKLIFFPTFFVLRTFPMK